MILTESKLLTKIKEYLFLHKSVGELKLLKDLKLDISIDELRRIVSPYLDIIYENGVLTWKDAFEE